MAQVAPPGTKLSMQFYYVLIFNDFPQESLQQPIRGDINPLTMVATKFKAGTVANSPDFDGFKKK